MMHYQLYIDGQFQEAQDGRVFSAINPATEESIATAALAGQADAHLAIHAARNAFDSGVWSEMPRDERAKYLKAISDKLNEKAKDLIKLEVADSGSTVRKAGEDVFLSARCMNYFSKLASQDLTTDVADLSKAGISKNTVFYEPVGVVGAIIPWNFPLKMAIWKLAPALAAGCTVVLKPSEETFVTAMELAKIIDEVGLPKGVVNIITGYGGEVGEELVKSPFVDKISFTGSTTVGKRIMQNAAGNLKKLTLECGGKSANIVLDDADFSIAVDGAVYAAFYHSGQCCEAGTRLLVSEKIYDDFVDAVIRKTKALRTGDPTSKDTDLGPLISKKQFDRVIGYIKAGEKTSAKLLTGGDVLYDKGFFVEPTIFGDVENTSTIAQEEIFGPVICIEKFFDDDEAIQLANQSIYGLGGAVWSKDDERAMQVAKRLRTGTVWINEYHLINEKAPFGGYKQSGIGREFGLMGLKEYTEAKHVHLDEGRTRDKKPWYDTIVKKS
jgi:betaine-aldehyde dehydrogenase